MDEWKMFVHIRTRLQEKKVLYASTCTHIFKAPSAPKCTKIAADYRFENWTNLVFLPLNKYYYLSLLKCGTILENNAFNDIKKLCQ